MADNQASSPGQITGNVMLYKKPEPLSVQAHGKLGLMAKGDFTGFVRDANFVPLMAVEFPAACAWYPIILAGENYTPLAVMGLREGQNAFAQEDGTWTPHTYVPGFIRRYPFVLASSPDGKGGVVCIDRAHPLIQENADQPFFENGQPSQLTRNAIDYLGKFEGFRQETERFTRTLKDLGVVEQMAATYTETPVNGGEPRQVQIAQYFAVSEEKLKALPADKLKDLAERGYLGLIYSHLISLNNWSQIISRSAERGFISQAELSQAAAGVPAGNA